MPGNHSNTELAYACETSCWKVEKLTALITSGSVLRTALRDLRFEDFLEKSPQTSTGGFLKGFKQSLLKRALIRLEYDTHSI